jgi:bleomycin hydrolase
MRLIPDCRMNGRYNHRELAAEIKLTAACIEPESDGFTAGDIEGFNTLLDEYIGNCAKNVQTAEGEYSPVEFRDKFGIDPDDYVELTSFAHRPFYKVFVLEVPDNWAHALYYNLPIDELMEVYASCAGKRLYHNMEW